MEIVTRLLQNISLIGTLVAWMVFVVGVCVGVLFCWPFRRRRDKRFERHILVLRNEVNNVDTEVDKLWKMAFPANYGRVPALLTINPQDADKKDALVVVLINARKMLESLAANLKSIALNVEPRSKRTAHVPPPQQESYVNEQHSIPITRQAFRRQQLQENYVDEIESTPAAVYDPPEDNMLQLYNRAVTDTVARERFREHFCPIRIGTINAVERRQNPTIKAEIRETTDGDFFAVQRGSNEFAVFPRLGLTIEAVSFGAGAIGEVYKTKGHDPKQFYSRYRVKKPAIFELEGELWVLREPGELEFSFGD